MIGPTALLFAMFDAKYFDSKEEVKAEVGGAINDTTDAELLERRLTVNDSPSQNQSKKKSSMR
jgi:hypothetical protein